MVCIYLQITLGREDILTILILLIHDYGTFFYLFVLSLISFFNDFQLSKYRSLVGFILWESRD